MGDGQASSSPLPASALGEHGPSATHVGPLGPSTHRDPSSHRPSPTAQLAPGGSQGTSPSMPRATRPRSPPTSMPPYAGSSVRISHCSRESGSFAVTETQDG